MASHKGEFIALGTGRPFSYEVQSWKDAQAKQHFDIDESNLTEVDYMMIKITDLNTKEIGYQTVTGPMLDWGFVEEALAYDWGEEGTQPTRR